MAEEIVSGQAAQIATPAEPSPAAPAEQQATTTEPTPIPVSIQAGKTLEQLSSELKEQVELTSQAEERAARAEHESAYTRNLIEAFKQERMKPTGDVPPAPEVTDEEFLTNPAKATARMFESYMSKERQERERRDREQYVNYARSAYEEGKGAAFKADPNLFKGIEQDVAREVFSFVQTSVVNGQPVDVAALKNPNYWKAAAHAYRLMRGEDMSKYYTKHVTPTTPVHTETPTTAGPSKSEITLTPEQEALISKAGIKREQFIEALAKERGITEGRNR